MCLAQAVVLEHQQYLDVVGELTDWLMTAGEELQDWSDTSGDSASIKRKLSQVRVRQGVNIFKKKILLLMQTDTPFIPSVYSFVVFDNWTPTPHHHHHQKEKKNPHRFLFLLW